MPGCGRLRIEPIVDPWIGCRDTIVLPDMYNDLGFGAIVTPGKDCRQFP